jgi:hypothetical protein
VLDCFFLNLLLFKCRYALCFAGFFVLALAGDGY